MRSRDVQDSSLGNWDAAKGTKLVNISLPRTNLDMAKDLAKFHREILHHWKLLSMCTQETVSGEFVGVWRVWSFPRLLFHSGQLILWFPEVYKSPSALRRPKLFKLALPQLEGFQTWWVVKGQGRAVYKETRGSQQPGNWRETTFHWRPEEAGCIYKLLSVAKCGWSWVWSLDQHPEACQVRIIFERQWIIGAELNLICPKVWEKFNKIPQSDQQ